MGRARLSDRRRLSLVLQAAALLSHLEAADWCLLSTWTDLRVDDDGLLCGARCQPAVVQVGAGDLLLDLIEILFGSRTEIIGKGVAKRVADGILGAWVRNHGPRPIDRLVTDLLRSAPFLWQPNFGLARRSLVAQLTRGSGSEARIAGPGGFELRMLESTRHFAELLELLASQGATEVWWRLERCAGSLSADASDLDRASRLYRAGRWSHALDALETIRGVAAGALAIHCQRRLGRLRLARARLEELSNVSGMTELERCLVTDAAVSLALDLGNPVTALEWLARFAPDRGRQVRATARLLRAEIALASGNLAEVARCTRANEGRQDSPLLIWRWYRLAAFQALASGEEMRAEEAVRSALRVGRRSMSKAAAADLWRLLARVLIERGELVAAEVAARHALCLVAAVDESAAAAASRLLAEILIRRGCAPESALDSRAMRSDPPHAGDGLEPTIGELLARRMLAQGHPAKAWRILEPLVDRNGRERGWRVARCCGLAARALGWLGRGAEAREILAERCANAPRGLEGEEYPPLWALAGDWQRARELTGRSAVGQLWRKALEDEPIADGDWPAVAELGAFRGARMVLDLELLVPGKVPRSLRTWAVSSLRRFGAAAFAEKLDRHRLGSWKALQSYLRSGSGTGSELARLFRSCGYFDVHLELQSGSNRRQLVAGHGGSVQLRAQLADGELRLAARQLDPVLKTLFTLAVREMGMGSAPADASAARASCILGRSSLLQQALARLERLAATDLVILIQGETGTGKELAARQLHHWSRRATQPFVAINCAALSETLILSELFGHVRGAFTGADRNRAGIFEAAAGGTVLLDEIGDLPMSAQGKLLRVLQEGEVRRLGESLPRRVDVRVIAATHRDLAAMLDRDTFRRDLFFRLKAGSVELPPLRRREGDVLLLSRHFLRGSGLRLTGCAEKRLLRYSWPGNVRELRNVIDVAKALNRGRLIDAAALELPTSESTQSIGYHQQVEEYRRCLVRQALVATDGHRAEAARRLNVSRQALSYLVRRFGIDPGR